MTVTSVGRQWVVGVRRLRDSIVVSNLLVMGSGMVGLILTSRYLGVADRGAYLTWSSWAALIGTLALLGAEAYIVVAAHSQEVTISVRSLRPMLFLGLGTAAIGTAAVLWIVAQDIEVVGAVFSRPRRRRSWRSTTTCNWPTRTTGGDSTSRGR